MPKRLSTEEKSMLASGIVHNFNNLLAAVLGQTSLARAKLAAGSAALEHLDRAMAACIQAADLTSEMLAHSTKEPTRLRLFSLNAVLYEALALVQLQLSVTPRWRLDLDAHIPLLEGDVDQLRCVLARLLVNAAKEACHAAGIVTVCSGVIRVGESTVIDVKRRSVLAPGDYAFLSVQTASVGMDAHDLKSTVDPLCEAGCAGQEHGLFAGLEALQLHRSPLIVESEQSCGGSFRIFFPLPDHTAPARPLSTVAPGAEVYKDTVLVVDDDPAVREVLAEAVQTTGLHALTAEDGRQGLETFRNHQRTIALTVLDMQMPVMNGVETAKELWKLEPDLPLILTSGYVEQRLVADLVRHPAAAFLPKPYTIDTFLTMLQGRLQLGSASSA